MNQKRVNKKFNFREKSGIYFLGKTTYQKGDYVHN